MYTNFDTNKKMSKEDKVKNKEEIYSHAGGQTVRVRTLLFDCVALEQRRDRNELDEKFNYLVS